MLIDWQRYRKYWVSRLAKLKGTPNSIAAGVACGAAVSFTPFVGAHLVLAMITAWIIRGNVIAAALGTAVGNPWTFPVIWVSVLYTGRKMLGMDYAQAVNVDFATMFSHAFKALINFDFGLFFSDIWPILWPMMIGCIPFYIIVWVLVYYLVKIMLNNRNNIKRTEVK